ncbi:TlpA disulfide reductase family protein [Pedobacter nyackensis]|uniref:TlpA family protein disulfide reductase n=1 Tax=Pedobacter nyackensis TaxID=475255 RepID=UPI00292D6D25|nr:TlpA disulfide reductase family protein [Pedobacter nyackensis]
MKKILLFCILIGSSVVSRAITKINGVFKVADNRSITIYLKEILAANETRKPYQQELNIGVRHSFSMKADIKKAAFFMLTVVSENEKNKSAHNSVIYLTPNDKLNLEFQGKGQFGLVCNYSKINSTDNKALFEINEKFNGLFRDLFNSKADVINQKEELKQFYVFTDEVLANKKISPEVQKYLKFNAFDVYNTHLYRLALDYNRGSKNTVPVGAGFYAQPVDPLFYFNDPTILLFPNGVSNVIRYLEVCTEMPVYKSRKSLEEINKLIEVVKGKVANKALVDEVIGSLLSSFTTSYKMTGNFDNDLQAYALIAHQINDLAIRSSVKKAFENLRYTMKGAALPVVKFENAAGETVSLDQFKGKYLFIDLWASWCVPCIKMTPFVQQLEKQYEGKNINFVAISIDANKQNWLSKMKELNMHGHQLLDLPNAFGKNLNITGIPHYMIYDPEGKLVVYKAVMPDNPKLKETIDQLPGL